jgi:hypothetical protein
MTSNTKETASLILRTTDIYDGALTNQTINVDLINNDIGQIIEDGAKIIWRNINPKLLLGDMYEKYTKFNLNLCSFSARKLNADLTDNALTYFISGLPWSNQSYSLKTKSITTQAVLMTTTLNADSTVGDSHVVNTNTLTFHRPNGNFDITIEILNGLDNYPNEYLNHQTFVIDIVGCDGYQRNPIINNQELPRNNIDHRLPVPSYQVPSFR